MKTRFVAVALLGVLFAGFFAGCGSLDDEGGIAFIKGQVVDAVSGSPVAGARVELVTIDRSHESTVVLTTSETGLYSYELAVDSISQVVLFASGSLYREETMNLLAVPEHEINAPAFRLQPTGGAGDGGGDPAPATSGEAASVTLTTVSVPNISVLESGFQETAQFVFTVLDSNGVAVDAQHSATIDLSIAAGPGGGEFISPSSATTDANGQVTFTLTSGTKAGAVQLLAETTAGGRTIRSKPAQIAIHGGLPDQAHFAAGPEQFNFPALYVLGASQKVTAYAGDQYGNPIRSGTVIYFTTTGGIIEGSSTTSASGAATVSLIANEPFPADGYATVTATTSDKDSNPVTYDFEVLFSGAPAVAVAPYTELALGDLYRFFVYDQNENPLAKGTTISVSVEGENVKVIGDTDVTLGDHLYGGQKVTEFQFTLAKMADTDDEGNPVPTRVDAVKINVTGPNGETSRTLLNDGTVFRMGD